MKKNSCKYITCEMILEKLLGMLLKCELGVIRTEDNVFCFKNLKKWVFQRRI